MTRKAYFVAGGNGGIGSAVCSLLEKSDFTAIAGYARQKPESGASVFLDLTQNDSIDHAVTQICTEYSDLAGVVLASSPAPKIGFFARITPEDLMHQLQVNAIGPQRFLAGLVKNIFRKNQAGSVIGVLTEAMGDGMRAAMPQMGAYVIAKHALNGVLKALAADYPWLNVQTVSPGFTETKMLKAFDERFLDVMRAQRQFQTVDEVANDIVRALCAEKGP